MAREHAMIKVSIWQDDDWRDLPANAKLLYLTLTTSATLTYCGVADWRPRRIAALVSDWTADDVIDAALILIERHYIVVDEATEECLVRSFIRNDGLMKQPKMAVSVALAYAGTSSRTIRGVIIHELNRLYVDQPGLNGWSRPQATELLRLESIDSDDLPLPDDDFGGEFRGDVGGGFTPGLGEPLPNASGLPKGLPTPAPTPTPTPMLHTPRRFDDFWAAYPKRVGKDAARKAYLKALKRIDEDRIVAGALRYANDANLPDKQFIPDPSSWLNAGRWDDEPCPPKTNGHAPRPNAAAQRNADAFATLRRMQESENNPPMNHRAIGAGQ